MVKAELPSCAWHITSARPPRLRVPYQLQMSEARSADVSCAVENEICLTVAGRRPQGTSYCLHWTELKKLRCPFECSETNPSFNLIAHVFRGLLDPFHPIDEFLGAGKHHATANRNGREVAAFWLGEAGSASGNRRRVPDKPCLLWLNTFLQKHLGELVLQFRVPLFAVYHSG